MIKSAILLIILFFNSSIILGQTITKKIFYDLPLENALDHIEETILDDTIHFKTFFTINNSRRFLPIKIDSILTLRPLDLKIWIIKMNSDKKLRSSITLILDFGKQNQNDFKLFYENLIEHLKPDYEYVKNENIKGSVTTGKKTRSVDEFTADFYDRRTDTKCKLSCSWFKVKKDDHAQLMISYYKDI